VFNNTSVRAKTAETPPPDFRLQIFYYFILGLFSVLELRFPRSWESASFVDTTYTQDLRAAQQISLHGNGPTDDIIKYVAVSGTRVSRHYSPGLWRKPRVVTTYLLYYYNPRVHDASRIIYIFNTRPNLLVFLLFLPLYIIPPVYTYHIRSDHHDVTGCRWNLGRYLYEQGRRGVSLYLQYQSLRGIRRTCRI